MAMIIVHNQGTVYTLRYTSTGFRVVILKDDGTEATQEGLHSKEVMEACRQLLHAMNLHAYCNQHAEIGSAETEPLP